MSLPRSGGFVLNGGLLMLVGALCLTAPQLYLVPTATLCGAALLAAAALKWVHWGTVRGWHIRHAIAISAAALTVAGLTLLLTPLEATMVLGIFFLVDGVAKLTPAITARFLHERGWFILHGVAAIAFSLMAFAQFPINATWLLAALVGLHLILKGWTLVVMGLAAKSRAAAELA